MSELLRPVNPAEIPTTLANTIIMPGVVHREVPQQEQTTSVEKITDDVPAIETTIEAIIHSDGPISSAMIETLRMHDQEVGVRLSDAELTNGAIREHVGSMKRDAEVITQSNIEAAESVHAQWCAQLEARRDEIIAEVTARAESAIRLESLRLMESVNKSAGLNDATASLFDSTDAASTENRRVINQLKNLRAQHIVRRDEAIATVNMLEERNQALPDAIDAAEQELARWQEKIEACEDRQSELFNELETFKETDRNMRMALKKEELDSIEATYAEGGPLPAEYKEQAIRNILEKATSPELAMIKGNIDLCESHLKHNKRSADESGRMYDELKLKINEMYLEQANIPVSIVAAREQLVAELSTPFTELEAVDGKIVETTDTFYDIVSGDVEAYEGKSLPKSLKNVWTDMQALRIKASETSEYDVQTQESPLFDDIDLSIFSDTLDGDESLVEMNNHLDESSAVSAQVNEIHRVMDLTTISDGVRAMAGRVIRKSFQATVQKAKQVSIVEG